MSTGAVETARRVRSSVGWFRLPERGLIEVSGSDRTSWLQGQITNDVLPLDPAGPVSGCYATVLTVKGAIIADLHVLAVADAFWLETDRRYVTPVLERLHRTLVADDVTLTDRSEAFVRFALEGPATAALFADVTGGAALPARESGRAVEIAGSPLLAAAWGESGLPAVPLFAPADLAEAVEQRVRAAGASHGLVEGDEAVLEILRVENGTPRLGPELDEEVFPAEARLDRALSFTKGCYTGQEIVERIRSRGAVNHLLVGLAFDASEPAPVGAELRLQGKKVGEVTSAAVSAEAGAIALGYARREASEPGTRLEAGERSAEVRALPFLAPAPPDGAPSSESRDR